MADLKTLIKQGEGAPEVTPEVTPEVRKMLQS